MKFEITCINAACIDKTGDLPVMKMTGVDTFEGDADHHGSIAMYFECPECRNTIQIATQNN